MAFGGGTFVAQNKILPGAYLNFVSVANASASLSERGIATIPLEMNWGPENQVFQVGQEEFQKNSQKIFGYVYTAEELKPMRELFRHAKTVYFFRLNSSGGKASCSCAEARHPGIRGNDLRIAVEESETSTPEAKRYHVVTWLGTAKVDEQKNVSSAKELKDNDFVIFHTDAELEAAASIPLTGGSNGIVEEGAYQRYLEQMEPYSFHAMGCLSTDPTVNGLFTDYCRRMRETVGKKFQVVLFRTLADYEGVVSVQNSVAAPLQTPAVVGEAAVGYSTLGQEKESGNPALIPWVTGVIAGTAVNQSASNLAYDGEYTVEAAYTQTELEEGLLKGSFLLHLVDGKAVVLEDVNTFVSVTEEKSADFSSNQTIRVLDQIANDIAVLFGTKYLGKVPNDAAGRISLWNDIVKHHQELQRIRAIEDFVSENVTVSQGESKKAVTVTDTITPVNAMTQLYMTVYVK